MQNFQGFFFNQLMNYDTDYSKDYLERIHFLSESGRLMTKRILILQQNIQIFEGKDFFFSFTRLKIQ